jgi:DNA invertase Pin-like site-specific DNA recombinase
VYDPSGPGRLLFAFFAAMAETERENIRESTLEGLDTAARKGRHGGRPQVITEDMGVETGTVAYLNGACSCAVGRSW